MVTCLRISQEYTLYVSNLSNTVFSLPVINDCMSFNIVLSLPVTNDCMFIHDS